MTDREKAITDQILKGNSLQEFIRAFWPILEPGREYVHNWHIDAIADHLAAASMGHIETLLINIPPRFMKSLMVCVFWFSWTWTFQPWTRWLFGSYDDGLSIRDSLKCRRLITSAPYRAAFGHVFNLAGDQNQKSRFENDKTGLRLSVGVGGGATGEGGDYIVFDDPTKPLDADSPAGLLTGVRWWDETMSTRGNSEQTVRVGIMQRLNEGDLSGHMLATERDMVHLCIPMRYEPELAKSTYLFTDPRTEPDELLWPLRFSEKTIIRLERRLGPYGTAGQLQQQPVPRGNALIQVEKIQIVGAAPAYVYASVLYFDKAASDKKTSDFSAAALLSITWEGEIFIEWAEHLKLTTYRREQWMHQVASRMRRRRPNVVIYVEQEGGSSGLDSMKATLRNLAEFDIHADPPKTGKIARAVPFAAQVEAGNVRMVEAPPAEGEETNWNEDVIAELRMFPLGKHDDLVDVVDGAYNRLFELGQVDNGARTNPPPQSEYSRTPRPPWADDDWEGHDDD